MALGERPYLQVYGTNEQGSEVYVPDSVASEYLSKIDAGVEAGVFEIVTDVRSRPSDLEAYNLDERSIVMPELSKIRFAGGGFAGKEEEGVYLYQAGEGGTVAAVDGAESFGVFIGPSGTVEVETPFLDKGFTIRGGLTLNGRAAFEPAVVAMSDANTIPVGDLIVVDATGWGDAASDVLTLSGQREYQIIYLRCASSGYNLTLKHNTGNIVTTDGLDHVVTNQSYTKLIYRNARWRVF